MPRRPMRREPARRTARPARVKLRVYLGDVHSLGPGKIELLEAIRAHRSISAAARSMGMAYRHAWVLIEAMNTLFREPVVTASTGGRHGGGAGVTPFGERIIRQFRRMERKVNALLRRDLAALQASARRVRRID